jgi:hypothetical protein
MSPGTPAHEEMIEFLERDQLVADTSTPVARLRLPPRARAGLWALRIFFLSLSVMVIWTFIAGLG